MTKKKKKEKKTEAQGRRLCWKSVSRRHLYKEDSKHENLITSPREEV